MTIPSESIPLMSANVRQCRLLSSECQRMSANKAVSKYFWNMYQLMSAAVHVLRYVLSSGYQMRALHEFTNVSGSSADLDASDRNYSVFDPCALTAFLCMRSDPSPPPVRPLASALLLRQLGLGFPDPIMAVVVCIRLCQNPRSTSMQACR